MTHISALPRTVPNYYFVNRQNYAKLWTDLLIIVTVYLINSYTRQRIIAGKDILIVGGLIIGWYIISKYSSLYNDFRTLTFVSEVIALLPSLLIQFVLLTVFLFFLNESSHTRLFPIYFVLTLGCIIILKMYILRKILHFWNKNGINQRILAVVGDPSKVAHLFKFIQQNSQFGYQVVGSYPINISTQQDNLLVNVIQYLNKTHSHHFLDEVIIVGDFFDESALKTIMQWTDSKGVLLRFTPRFLQFQSSRFTLELLGGKPLVTVRGTLLDTDYYWAIKRIFDFVIGGLLFLFLGCLLTPIISLFVKLESDGPIFTKTTLLGKGSNEFTVWGFRTSFKSQPTNVGKFLIHTRLDKLPMLLNIFKGQMSMVGPKAYKRAESFKMESVTTNYKIRYQVLPGILNWADTNDVATESPNEPSVLQKMVDYDNWYIENWSLLLDFEIIFKTFYKITRRTIFREGNF